MMQSNNDQCGLRALEGLTAGGRQTADIGIQWGGPCVIERGQEQHPACGSIRRSEKMWVLSPREMERARGAFLAVLFQYCWVLCGPF